VRYSLTDDRGLVKALSINHFVGVESGDRFERHCGSSCWESDESIRIPSNEVDFFLRRG
jgi:hypothetical protein